MACASPGPAWARAPPLVKAANWLSHLDLDLESPVWRHWLRELSRDHTLIRYDERGCGLSDWEVEEFSVDAWVRDLEAVVEAAGLDRFALLGISQGGPVAIAYAVKHPERVSHLDPLRHLRPADGRSEASIPDAFEEQEALMTLTRVGWGRDTPAYRQVFAELFMPDADEAQFDWFNELQRVSTSPENAVRFQRAFPGDRRRGPPGSCADPATGPSCARRYESAVRGRTRAWPASHAGQSVRVAAEPQSPPARARACVEPVPARSADTPRRSGGGRQNRRRRRPPRLRPGEARRWPADGTSWMSTRRQRVEELFEGALELSQDEREAFPAVGVRPAIWSCARRSRPS